MVLTKVTAEDIILDGSEQFHMKEGFYNSEGIKVTYRDMYFNVDKMPAYHIADFLQDVLAINTSGLKSAQIKAKYLELVEGSYSGKIKKDVKSSSQPFIQLPAPMPSIPSVPSVPFIPLPSPIYSIPSTGRKTVKKISKKKTSVKKSSKKSSRKTVKKISKKSSKKVSKKSSKKSSKKGSKKSSKKTGSRKRKY